MGGDDDGASAKDLATEQLLLLRLIMSYQQMAGKLGGWLVWAAQKGH